VDSGLNFAILWVDVYIDALSIYFVFLVNLVAFFASWYVAQFLAHEGKYEAQGSDHNPATFHFFFNAFHLTMLVVPVVDNLVILWMAVELTTVASVLLVRYRGQRRRVEAAWKYILITSAGIVFALFGTIMLADAIGADTCKAIRAAFDTCGDLPPWLLMRWSELARPEVAQTLDGPLVRLAFLLALVGYGAKAGLAPLHTWLPDSHGEAPPPVSALLSGVLLKSGLYVILRFYTIANLAFRTTATQTRFTSGLLLFLGLFSLLVATPAILKQTDNRFKRVLAYHSLEHMGIILFGLGIGTAAALFGALLHALNHALTKAFMFLSFAIIRRQYQNLAGGPELPEAEITGVLHGMPINGAMLMVGGLGLVGAPPFGIFLSIFIILWAALGRVLANDQAALGPFQPPIYLLAVVIFLLTLALIFGGLVGHLGRLLLGHSRLDKLSDPPFGEYAPLLILLGMVLLFGIWIPTQPVNFPALLERSVAILQTGAQP
jgi:hydrogenase-4 component F